ncbi:DNRLRE domain-containing protein [Clostridium sp. CF011]|uniref:DNRLRE domain-containing protein n=1 Tax=Clostridium sp. CF011 TaxID=2843318 RepID=UPI001C0AE781|nr:DNRLRE domain-containing protein [Clostridium sp. CF011]MBU3090538.1 DNRLRE domain-containing protein [Clostridium sp. CF011]WAG69899.1 DNRLRE domain-containing protein [Clostridium sp. CF011]
MESIIIPSTKSLTLTNKIPTGNINKDYITVGNDGVYTYSSLLFFDISTIPNNAEITNAEIVLFKTDNFYKNKKKCINIYPLFDYFSNYTTYKNPPKVNHLIEGSIYPITSKISVTANLTKIVSLWFKNSNSNKGIILCKKNNDFITNFGSAMCNDSNLIPFIKVIYCIKNTIVIQEKHTSCKDECNHNIENHTSMKVIYYPCPCNCNSNPNPGIPTTRQVKVTGIVAPMAIYESIVKLAVTRNGTGHADNYYITDEYDNSSSNTPLAIDKIYNIPVLPKANPGDTENVDFYGAYKGNSELFL